MSSAAIAKNYSELSTCMEDYVIVPQLHEIRDDDDSIDGDCGSDGDDVESYDHCEDVFSHGTQDAEDQDDNNSVASQYAYHKDNIVISVPSGLMKDLDDAHAAAELARVSDVSAQNESESVSTQDTPVQEPEEDHARSIPNHLVIDDKAAMASMSDGRVEQEKNSCSPVALAGIKLSRASNKKRRKKLKLMKKAQAAAKAADALCTRAVDSSKGNQCKKMVSSTSPTSRTTPRKVANIAVACARETIASYRQELLCSSMS